MKYIGKFRLLNDRYRVLGAGGWGLGAGFWLLVAGCWLLVAGFSPQDTEGGLQINVSNIYPVEGELYVAIYDDASSYMDLEKAAFQKKVSVKNKEEIILIDNIPDGEYAVSIFQDLNGNSELDRSSLGIPQEPYGFSNDARGSFGPPKYKKAKFKVSDKTSINITLVNNENK